MPRLDKVPAENLAAQEDTLQVYAHDPVKFILADVKKGGRRVYAGPVDHNVDPPRAPEDGAKQGLQLGAGCDLGAAEPRPPARGRDPRNPRLGLFGVPTDDHHLGVGRGESLGNGPAKLARANHYLYGSPPFGLKTYIRLLKQSGIYSTVPGF